MVRHVALSALVAALALAGCGGGSDGGTTTRSQGSPARGTGTPVPERYWPGDARYELDVDWDADRATLSGEQRIAFANTGPRTLTSVWLRLWGNAFGGCARRRVRVSVTSGGTLGARRARCTAREVRLPEPLAPGARTELALRIRVRVPEPAGRFGRLGGVSYLGNALPILAVADARGFKLPPYTGGGESFFSLTAAWRVALRVPEGIAVASTGTATSTEPLVLEAPRARDFMLVIGRMRVTERRAGGVLLRHFAPAGAARGGARRALRWAAGALARFERWYGPYDRPELDVVAADIAMEYPELVLTPPSPGAVTHEVAHQWWWGIVGNDQRAEPWLDESFAEFSQARLPPAVGGGDRLGRCARPRRRPRLTAGMGVWEDARGGAYARDVYIGGACMLRRLSARLGERRFDAMLRAVVDEHRDGVWTRADFVAAVERAAPTGFDARAFLRREGILG